MYLEEIFIDNKMPILYLEEIFIDNKMPILYLEEIFIDNKMPILYTYVNFLHTMTVEDIMDHPECVLIELCCSDEHLIKASEKKFLSKCGYKAQ